MMVLKKSTRWTLTAVLIVACFIVLYMLDNKMIGSSYIVRIVRLSAIYALIGVSMNLVNGFTGLFSLGQAGFMAIGAYTVGVLTIPPELRPNVYYLTPMADKLANVDVPIVAALIIGGLLAAGFAFLIGAPVLRLKSDYLAIATLGFSEIIRAIIANDQLAPITNGSLGLKSIPGFEKVHLGPLSFGNLFWPVMVCVVCIAFMVLLTRSSYGRAFKAIREDEIAAEAMGIGLFKHKQMSFVISGFFAGIGGGLLAAHLTAIDSNQFKITVTYELLLIVVLGGMGSITGTCISAFLITAGKEWLRFFDSPQYIGDWQIPIFRAGLRMVIFSLLLMAIVLFYRRGIMGTSEFSWDGMYQKLQKWFHWFRNIGKGRGPGKAGPGSGKSRNKGAGGSHTESGSDQGLGQAVKSQEGGVTDGQ